MPAIAFGGKSAIPANNVGFLINGAPVGASGTLPGAPVPVSTYIAPARKPIKYTLSGSTLDSTGAALGNCNIEVYETINGVVTKEEPKGRLVNMTTSNSAGAYSVDVYSWPGVTFRVDAYKPGGTDVAGTTLNTLVGTQVA
jgi:hypothetical protein